MNHAIVVEFNAVTMSCNFTFLHLDYIMIITVLNKKYYSKFISLEFFHSLPRL